MKTQSKFSIALLLLMAVLTITGCKKNPPTPTPAPVPATVKMNAYNDLGLTSVTVNFTVTPNDSKISESGVYLNVRSLLDGATKVAASAKSGIITLSLNGLKQNTKYYIWAYVQTAKGTSYSSMLAIWTYAVMDVDGYGYHAVEINGHLWTVENLRTTHYRNGDPIPNVTDSTAWYNDKQGALCYYNNNKAKYDSVYGALYNFYAIKDPRGLAPQGWHVPSDHQYVNITNNIGNTPLAGGKMKEAGTEHWHSPNTGATNSTGFTALPGGARSRTVSHPTSTNYVTFGYYGVFWSNESGPAPNTASAWYLEYNDTWLNEAVFYDNSGLSVRLIKN